MKKHRSKNIPLVTKRNIVFCRNIRFEDDGKERIVDEDLIRDPELWNYLIKEEKIDFEWGEDI